jgi:hypothetical protein
MAKKRDSASTAPIETPSGVLPEKEKGTPLSDPSPDQDEKVGFTGLPLNEQRSNLIKIAIFLGGAAALVFGLKMYLGW